MEIRAPETAIRYVASRLALPQGLLLREGSVFATRVRGGASAPYLLLDGRKFPLPEGVPVPEGKVFVRVTQVEPEVVLQIQPRGGGSSATASAGRPDSTMAILSHLLRALGGRVPPSPTAPVDLGPEALAARALLSLFSESTGLGESIDSLRILLQRAASERALSGESQQLIQKLLELLGGAESELPALLRRLAEDARRTKENRLARSLLSQDPGELTRLKASLGTQTAQLLRDPTVLEYAERTGQRNVLENVVRAILERLSGRDFQNLRGIDYPYLFLEVPFGKDAPIRRALVHFFGEGEDDGSDSRFENATVALDVSTARLGDLWVTLHVVGSTCVCKFRTDREDTLQAVGRFASDLVKTLEQAGYAKASVTASLWHGSRFAETAASMRRFATLDETV